MSTPAIRILVDDVFIGNASTFSTMPSVLCPNCGARLHRVYNTQSDWKYICMAEKKLIDIESNKQPVKVVTE